MEERSKKLARQYKRYLGSADAEKLIAEAAGRLAQGQKFEDDQELLGLLGNFSAFAEAIDNAYAEYDDRLKVSARNIEISSRELTEAYRNLEKLNLSINTMLDSLGHGLLFFDQTGMCSKVYSKVCVEMLETSPADMYLPDVLKFTDEETDNFKTWLNIVFGGNLAMDFQDLKALLPQETTNSKGAVIRLDYKPMYLVDDKLTGILLIATDVTRQLAHEKELHEAQNEVLKIQQLAQNRNEFSNFLFNVQGTLDTFDTATVEDDESRNSYLRALHTLKGQALFFRLESMGQEIHRLENKLKKREITTEAFGPLYTHLKEAKEQGRKLFGNIFMAGEQFKCIDLSKVTALKDLVLDSVHDESAKESILSYINAELLSSPIFEKFESFKKEVDRLAEQMGKPEPECTIKGDNILILAHEYEDVFNALIHVARNIMDHGIEGPRTREEKNKTPYGCITIEVQNLDDRQIKILISDDGAGINPDKIRQRLQARSSEDYSHESDEQILNHIFDDSFSTRDEASLVSGQGVGMSAVKQSVCDLGGDIAVHSGFHKDGGTRLHITLPFIQ